MFVPPVVTADAEGAAWLVRFEALFVCCAVAGSSVLDQSPVTGAGGAGESHSPSDGNVGASLSPSLLTGGVGTGVCEPVTGPVGVVGVPELLCLTGVVVVEVTGGVCCIPSEECDRVCCVTSVGELFAAVPDPPPTILAQLCGMDTDVGNDVAAGAHKLYTNSSGASISS